MSIPASSRRVNVITPESSVAVKSLPSLTIVTTVPEKVYFDSSMALALLIEKSVERSIINVSPTARAVPEENFKVI